MSDPVNHPKHYSEGREYEPIDVIDDWELNFALGNCVKYIARCDSKGEPIEDLEKARFYLDYEIKKRRKMHVSGSEASSSDEKKLS